MLNKAMPTPIPGDWPFEDAATKLRLTRINNRRTKSEPSEYLSPILWAAIPGYRAAMIFVVRSEVAAGSRPM